MGIDQSICNINRLPIFKIKANVSHYDSREQESLLHCFVTVCCASHLWRPPGITFCYSVNHSWAIPHGRLRWTWASAQTYKERRRKRNNNKLNHVWTTPASQVSWIFAMNSKLNRSSLYYWQRDMLIALIICAVFYGATSMNNSQTVLLRFKNNIWSAYTPGIPEDLVNLYRVFIKICVVSSTVCFKP